MIKNICLFFLFSSSLYAQAPINKGETAPEDGVFLTREEAIDMIVDKETAQKKHQLELDLQKKQSDLICEGQKNVKDLMLNAEKDKSKSLLEIKDKQIDNLYKQLQEESGDYRAWWFVGGAVIGTVASITIFFAATQADKMPALIGN